MLFFSYVYRSIRARKRAYAVTVFSIALFVAGGSIGLAFYRSLSAMLVDTAPPDTVLVLAKGATEEGESEIDLETGRKLAVLDGIRKDGDLRLVAQEVITTLYLNTPDYDRYEEGTSIRGIDAASFAVHRAKLISGALPPPGSLDVVIGKGVAARYANLTLGAELHLPGGSAHVAGVFEAGGSPYEDEVWTSRSALDLHLKTHVLTSVTLVAEAGRTDELVAAINANKDLDSQAAPLATFRSAGAGLHAIARTVLLMLISLSLVATFVIATTMSASVAVRMPELATLAAIGIRKSVLARYVLLESLLVAAIGALIGVAVGEVLRRAIGRVTLGDNPVTLTSGLPLVGLGLGIVVGAIGAVAPALQVRRLGIVETLR